MVELEAELDQLRSSLEERGAQLCEMIKEEEQRKKAELKVCSRALLLCAPLLLKLKCGSSGSVLRGRVLCGPVTTCSPSPIRL